MNHVIKQIKVGNQVYKLQDSVITDNGTNFIFGTYDEEGYLIGSITVPEVYLYDNLTIKDQDGDAELTLNPHNGLIIKNTAEANIIIEGKQSGTYSGSEYPDEFIEYFSVKEMIKNEDIIDEETEEIIDTETTISHSLYFEGDATIDGTLKTNKIENHSTDGGIVIGSGSASGIGTVALGDSAASGNYSLAEGYKTIAGCNGYYISAICPKNPTANEGYIFLTNEQLTTPPAWITDERNLNYWDSAFTLDYKILNDNDATLNNYVANGNKFCISSNAYYHWALAGDMTDIAYNRIKYTSDTLNTDEKWLANKDNGADPMVFFIPAQPGAGTTSVGLGSHAEGWESHAAAEHSHAEGYATLAAARYGHAEGRGSIAGYSAHAEGQNTEALGLYSHSEGANTKALNSGAHAEGETTEAKGKNSHAEGLRSVANGAGAHAEGCGGVKAIGDGSHAEGNGTEAHGITSHAEGLFSKATGARSHAEGRGTIAAGDCQHVEGVYNIEDTGTNTITENKKGAFAHIVGNGTSSKRSNAYTLDWSGNAEFAGKVTAAQGIATPSLSYDATIININEIAGRHNATTKGEIFNTYSDTTDFNKNEASAYSHAEGRGTKATGTGSHAEGRETVSSGVTSHAEGVLTVASGRGSHAEGGCVSTDTPVSVHGVSVRGPVAQGEYSHAEGKRTAAVDIAAHAEGLWSYAGGRGAHAEGGYYDWENEEVQFTFKNNILSPLTKQLNVGSEVIDAPGAHAEGTRTTARGRGSHTEGAYSVTWGSYSHAEGRPYQYQGTGPAPSNYPTLAYGAASHAEGESTIAFGIGSHSEGSQTIAKGDWSHVEGQSNEANGNLSHAGGFHAIADGKASLAHGWYTEAKGRGTVAIGYYNADKSVSPDVFNAEDNAFIIGGLNTSKSNVFRVDYSGNVYATNSSLSTGADYAEYFEWEDNNPHAEDRIGHFVTLTNGNQIKLANIGDDILGIISGHAAIVGDAYEDNWNQTYDRDIYGRLQYEEVEVESEEMDEAGNIITTVVLETHAKLNPDYDPTQTYIPRSERPEWAPVGLLGKLVVIDDGSCVPGGKCACGINGIAMASDTGYHVLKRLDATHIQILLK